MLFFRPFNLRSLRGGAEGFSLSGVLVGVALLGISSVIISNTVIEARRSQQKADIKLSSNKLQQAVLDAVTGRIKEFMLDKCSGERWGGAGSTEVEKAFSRIEIPVGGASSGGGAPALKFYNVDVDIPTSFKCSDSLGPALMNSSDPNSGEYLRFCMNIDPSGHPSISQRLLELLVVPVNLASDSAITCANARGAGAGVKVTWQMHSKIDSAKVKGSGSDVQVLKESGTFLISAETESYSGTCNITATRQGTTDQCTVNVSGLGRRPPTLIKNGAVATGITWARATSANNDAFTTTALCETNQPTTFTAQSADGGTNCSRVVLPTYTLTTSVSPAGSGTISRSPNADTYSHGSSVTLTAIPAAGYSFANWSGACSGTSTTCNVVMDSNKSVTANFNRVCSVSNLRVGIWGRYCGVTWCNVTETYNGNWIQLPNDATNIDLTASTGLVDDSDPEIRINGSLFYKSIDPIGVININKKITNLTAGMNDVQVSAYNVQSYFSLYFLLSGTYKAASCTHQTMFCEWKLNINNCVWVNDK